MDISLATECYCSIGRFKDCPAFSDKHECSCWLDSSRCRAIIKHDCCCQTSNQALCKAKFDHKCICSYYPEYCKASTHECCCSNGNSKYAITPKLCKSSDTHHCACDVSNSTLCRSLNHNCNCMHRGSKGTCLAKKHVKLVRS
jgi:hypothetical protein